MEDFVSYTFLQGQGEESSADSFSDMFRSAPSNWRNTLGVSSSSASGTESCPGSPCGMTSEPSMGTPGEGGSMLWPGDSPARTSPAPVRGPESTGNGAAFGLRWPGSFVRFDPDSSSWKTAQCSLLGDLEEFSGTWPRWGSMRAGECWALTMLEPPIIESESGYVPTPVKADSKQTGPRSQYRSLYRMIFDAYGGRLNPEYHEWLMGWPTGSTALQPLGMDKFQAWLRLHGRS